MERSILFIERIFCRMNDNDKIILDEFTERIWDATLSFIIEIDKYKLYEEYLKEVHNIDFKINKKNEIRR